MDVGLEGVGLPAAHFLDGEDGAPSEMHGHGSAGMEGVAADIGEGVALLEEAGGLCAMAHRIVDVAGRDVLGLGRDGGIDGMDGGVEVVVVREDVVDAAGKGFDYGEVIAGAVLGDALAFLAVLLGALLLMIMFPGIVLWLPRMFGYQG